MKKNSKYLIAVVAICFVALLLFTGQNKDKADKNQEDGNKEAKLISEYVKIQKYSIDLKKDLKGDTPYGELYYMAKTYFVKGKDEQEAKAFAENGYVQRAALLKYAAENNITAGEEEVDTFIKNSIEDYKKEKNHDLVEEACKENGITFEDTIWENRDTYRKNYIISKIPDNKKEGFVKKQVDNYKKSDEYKAEKPVIKQCLKLMFTEDGMNTDKLKSEKIFI